VTLEVALVAVHGLLEALACRLRGGGRCSVVFGGKKSFKPYPAFDPYLQRQVDGGLDGVSVDGSDIGD
jgi:hypothetical protein